MISTRWQRLETNVYSHGEPVPGPARHYAFTAEHGETALGMSLCSYRSLRVITIRLGPTDVILDDSRGERARLAKRCNARFIFLWLLCLSFFIAFPSRLANFAKRRKKPTRSKRSGNWTRLLSCSLLDESTLSLFSTRFLNPLSRRSIPPLYHLATVTLRGGGSVTAHEMSSLWLRRNLSNKSESRRVDEAGSFDQTWTLFEKKLYSRIDKSCLNRCQNDIIGWFAIISRQFSFKLFHPSVVVLSFYVRIV